MDNLKNKGKKVEDVEVPNLDEQMDAWCTISEQKDNTKSADDLEVDAWCENTTVEQEGKKKTK
jgi:hypothetical protein